MRNKLCVGLLMMSTAVVAADWGEATGKLTPGGRIEVHHQGKIDRGLFALANGSEIVITKSGNGFVAIPKAEVDRVITHGSELPNLSYFANAKGQLFPKSEVVYERTGAAPRPKAESKRHWWFKR